MELFKTNLHLFDGEGGEGVASPATGEETASTPDAPSVEDRKKAYAEFKKANKALFTEDFQGEFNKRFKSAKQNETELAKYKELTSILYSKYNVDSFEGLQAAMDADDSLIMDKADEAGMTPEQYRQYYKLEKENKAFKEAEEQRKRDAIFGQQVERWRNESAELAKLYPNFNLDTEYENPVFRAVLNSGVSVREAFQTVHFDELMAARGAMTEKAVADNIRAKGNRPVENGTGSQSAFKSKINVNDLSGKDIRELIQRANRGEVITFG